MEESKLMLLDIMDTIDRFCRQESICYSLAYGTLIGAIRHHGFIPWDDDIDIIMPRKDYDRFITSFKAENYHVFSPEEDPSYPLQYARVSDVRTYSVDQHGNASYLAIDVFPLDGVPDGAVARKMYLTRIKLLTRLWSSQVFTKKLSCSRDYPFRKNCMIVAAKCIGKVFGLKAVANHFIRVKHLFPMEGTQSCSSLSEPGVLFESGKMVGYTDGQFEGHTYRIPVDYDYQLRLIYGEYMTMPPVEAQVNHGARTYWR